MVILVQTYNMATQKKCPAYMDLVECMLLCSKVQFLPTKEVNKKICLENLFFSVS